MWDSFNAFAISGIESSKEEKIQRMTEWRQEKVVTLTVAKINEALRKRRRYGVASTRALNEKLFYFSKTWLCY